MTHIYNTSHLNINKPPKHFLSITHEIYKSFGEGYETRSVFFDISKACDKVWHKVLPHKPIEKGILGHLLNIATDLYQQKQRVVLNGQYPLWAAIKVEVPPLSLVSHPKLFADDTSLFSVVENMSKLANDVNNDLAKISTWAFQWKMNFTPHPTKQIQGVIFSRKGIIFSHKGLFLVQSSMFIFQS